MTAKDSKPTQEAQYLDSEVNEIMLTLHRIYALDDAIANQVAVNRPNTFIQPLIEIRKWSSDRLTALTAKSIPEQKEEKKQE